MAWLPTDMVAKLTKFLPGGINIPRSGGLHDPHGVSLIMSSVSLRSVMDPNLSPTTAVNSSIIQSDEICFGSGSNETKFNTIWLE